MNPIDDEWSDAPESAQKDITEIEDYFAGNKKRSSDPVSVSDLDPPLELVEDPLYEPEPDPAEVVETVDEVEVVAEESATPESSGAAIPPPVAEPEAAGQAMAQDGDTSWDMLAAELGLEEAVSTGGPVLQNEPITASAKKTQPPVLPSERDRADAATQKIQAPKRAQRSAQAPGQAENRPAKKSAGSAEPTDDFGAGLFGAPAEQSASLFDESDGASRKDLADMFDDSYEDPELFTDGELAEGETAGDIDALDDRDETGADGFVGGLVEAQQDDEDENDPRFVDVEDLVPENEQAERRRQAKLQRRRSEEPADSAAGIEDSADDDLDQKPKRKRRRRRKSRDEQDQQTEAVADSDAASDDMCDDMRDAVDDTDDDAFGSFGAGLFEQDEVASRPPARRPRRSDQDEGERGSRPRRRRSASKTDAADAGRQPESRESNDGDFEFDNDDSEARSQTRRRRRSRGRDDDDRDEGRQSEGRRAESSSPPSSESSRGRSQRSRLDSDEELDDELPETIKKGEPKKVVSWNQAIDRIVDSNLASRKKGTRRRRGKRDNN